ncbi:hypothetical protein ACET3Z_031847 [Daucus carota]
MEARGSSQIQRSCVLEEAPNVKGKGLLAIMANRGRYEIAQVTDQDHDDSIENYVANFREQSEVVPRRFGLGAMEDPPNQVLESGHLSSGATDVISSSSGLQTLNWEPSAGAISDVVIGLMTWLRENEQLSKYGDMVEARGVMMTELKKIIEANPVFNDKLVFPSLRSSRLPALVNQRYEC